MNTDTLVLFVFFRINPTVAPLVLDDKVGEECDNFQIAKVWPQGVA